MRFVLNKKLVTTGLIAATGAVALTVLVKRLGKGVGGSDDSADFPPQNSEHSGHAEETSA